VINEGLNTATFDVTMTIDGYTSTRTVTNLASEATEQVEFDPWTSGDPLTAYDIVVYTTFAPDMNPDNDTMAVNYTVASYCEDFEIWDGMYEPDPDVAAWEHGVPTSGPMGAHSGENLWATNLQGNYENNAQWRLYTLEFHAPMDNPIFTYWHWYNTESFWDGYNVKMSTDEGASWNIIDPIGGYPEDGIYGMGYEPGFSASSAGWQMVTFILPVVESDQLRLQFHFGSDPSVNSYPGVYIDDICAILEPKYPPPDIDIDDNDGDLSANTMTLAGPTGSVVVGEFNLINPEEDLGGMNCPNVDYYDGPSTINELVAFTFPTTLTSVGGGHAFNPTFYNYTDTETGEMAFTTLALCQSRRVLLQVGIPHPCTPNKVYEGVVGVTGTADFPPGVPLVLTDDDDFGLYVHVVPTGGGNIWGPGFKGTPSADGNFLEWTGLAFGQQGYNVYRSEGGSSVRLNESLLTESSFVDRDVREGQVHEYKLGLPLANGEEILIGPVSVTRGMKPRVSALYQNFPNPTRDETTIRYAVASDTKVSLRVFNVAGQVVKTLVDEEQKAGYYQVSWTPEDDASGVYFYRLTAGDFSQTMKLVVLK
jgi:hypothetical protein